MADWVGKLVGNTLRIAGLLCRADVHRLIDVLQTFVDAGNTVVVIEHNLDVIKTADTVIDLGPRGGDRGGEIVAYGTPEDVAKTEASLTGMYLKKVLNAENA